VIDIGIPGRENGNEFDFISIDKSVLWTVAILVGNQISCVVKNTMDLLGEITVMPGYVGNGLVTSISIVYFDEGLFVLVIPHFLLHPAEYVIFVFCGGVKQLFFSVHFVILG
jgi:hypothetical protein